MKRLFNKNHNHYFAALFLSFVFIVLQAINIYPMKPNDLCCDHLFYRAMAFNLFTSDKNLEFEKPVGGLAEVYNLRWFSRFMKRENPLSMQPPYCYRVLTPFFARVMGFILPDFSVISGIKDLTAIERSFFFISFFSLWITGFLLYVFLLDLGFTKQLSLWGIFFYSIIKPGVPYLLKNFMLVDPLQYVLMLAGLILIVRKKPIKWLMLLLSISILNKEHTVALIPVYYFYNAQSLFDLDTFKKTCLLSMPVITIFLLLRVIITPPFVLPNFLLAALTIPRGVFDNYKYLLSFFGCTGLLAVIFSVNSSKEIKRLSSLLLFVLFQMFFFRVNIARLMFYAFPIVISTALYPLIKIAKHHKTIVNNILGVVGVLDYFFIHNLNIRLYAVILIVIVVSSLNFHLNWGPQNQAKDPQFNQ